MEFITNTIVNPTGNGVTFNDWLEKMKKEASEAKPECDGDPRGGCRGQVINNDNEEGAGSYQEGESVDGKKEQGGNARKDAGGETDQKDNEQKDKEAASSAAKKVEAKCGKEMGESDDAGKVTDKHTEAGPGDDENPEPKTLINDDPNYQKGESVDPAKATSKSKKGPDDRVGKSSETTNKFKKVASLNRAEKLALFAKLSSVKSNPIEYVEAMVGMKFANMTEEEKSWFKEYWKILYPSEYADEMAKDR